MPTTITAPIRSSGQTPNLFGVPFLRPPGNRVISIDYSRYFPGAVPVASSPNLPSASRTGGQDQLNEQEFQFVNTVFDPNGVQAQLQTNRTNTRTNLTNVLGTTRRESQGLLDRTLANLGTGRESYRTGATSLLEGQEKALNEGRTNYFTKAQAGLDADTAEAARQLAEFQNAEQAAADQAVAQGFRDAKAMFTKRGTGASSYSERIGAGIRLKAATDLAQRVAERRRQDRLAQMSAQRALDAAMADRERGDLAAIYGDRSRLFEALAGQERTDLGFGFNAESDILSRDAAAQLALEQEMMNRESEDLRYLLGERERLLGQRTPLLAPTTPATTSVGSFVRGSAGGGNQVASAPPMFYRYF